MSDNTSDSDNISVTDLDNSVTEDINSLIDTCYKLHANIIDADNLLGNIKDIINMGDDTIYIISDGIEMDFYDFLESLHKEAISNIEDGVPNRFEDALLDAVDKLV